MQIQVGVRSPCWVLLATPTRGHRKRAKAFGGVLALVLATFAAASNSNRIGIHQQLGKHTLPGRMLHINVGPATYGWCWCCIQANRITASACCLLPPAHHQRHQHHLHQRQQHQQHYEQHMKLLYFHLVILPWWCQVQHLINHFCRRFVCIYRRMYICDVDFGASWFQN